MKYMVFDVESIGLHGDGFAVGWVVVDEAGVELSHGEYACDQSYAHGLDDARKWVVENVSTTTTCLFPKHVRAHFWKAYREAAADGAILVADCAWPVEARFLAACVDDDLDHREWEGPYPLHDLASIVLTKGGDPLVARRRRPNELPVHNPLADARQSARLLLEALHPQRPPKAKRTEGEAMS